MASGPVEPHSYVDSKPVHEWIISKDKGVNNAKEVAWYFTADDWYAIFKRGGVEVDVGEFWHSEYAGYDIPISEKDIEWLLTTDTGYNAPDGAKSKFMGDLPSGTCSILMFWALGGYYEGSQGDFDKDTKSLGNTSSRNMKGAYDIIVWAMEAEECGQGSVDEHLYERDQPGPWAMKLIDWCLTYQGMLAKESFPAGHKLQGPLTYKKAESDSVAEFIPKGLTGLPFQMKVAKICNEEPSRIFEWARQNDPLPIQTIDNYSKDAEDQWSFAYFTKNVIEMMRGEKEYHPQGMNEHFGWASYDEDDSNRGGMGFKKPLVWVENGDTVYEVPKYGGEIEVKQFHAIRTLGQPDGQDWEKDGGWFAYWFTPMRHDEHFHEHLGGEYGPWYDADSAAAALEPGALWDALRICWKGGTDLTEERGEQSAKDYSKADFRSYGWVDIAKSNVVWQDETAQALKNYVPRSIEIYFDDSEGTEVALGKLENGKGTVKSAPSGGKKLVVEGLTGEWQVDTGATELFSLDTTFPDEDEVLGALFHNAIIASQHGPDHLMSMQWAQKHLNPDMEGPFPGNADEASSMLATTSEEVKEAFRNSKKKLKLSSVRMRKSKDSFTDLTGNFEFGKDMFYRFYVAAYVNVIFYNMVYAKHGKGKAKIPLNEMMRWTAYWAARLMTQLWTQFIKDHHIGNIYGLLVAYHLLEPDIADQLAEFDENIVSKDAKDTSENTIADMAQSEPVPEELGEQDKDQRERLYKQCALLLNMDKLYSNKWVGNLPECANNKNHVFHSEEFGSYRDRIAVVQSSLGRSPGEKPETQSNNLLNKLIAPKAADVKRFLDLTVPEAANLVPFVRLYKVENNTQQEFKFQLAPDPNRIKGLQGNSFDRGDGVGLKELTWEYDGETPATATKYIKAKMTLLFQNFQDFIKLRKGADGEYRYVDLFVSPTNMDKREHFYHAPHALQYDPNYYRIKLEVGYSPTNLQDKQLQRAIKRINRSFFLVLIDNEISINEDMTVSITANYRAYIEEAMDSYKFNALTSPDILRERAAMRAAWDKAIGTDVAGCSPLQLSEMRVMIDGKMEELAKKAHQSIMTRLLDHNKIHYVDFNVKAIDEFRSSGVFSSIPQWTINGDKQRMPPKSKEKFKEWIKGQSGDSPVTYADPFQPEGNYRSYFFYLGDLLYVLASNLYGDKEMKKDPLVADLPALEGAENTRFVLLDFEYHVSLDKSSPNKVMNIADIPISTDFFVQWYADVVIKGDLLTMPVGSFLKKILIELISEALAESCVAKSPDHRVSFGLGSYLAGGIQIPSDPKSYIDPLTYMMRSDKTTRLDANVNYNKNNNKDEPPKIGLPLMNYVQNAANLSEKYPNNNPIEGQFNYIFLYADYENPAHPGRGKKKTDHEGGTFHLNVGRDVGLVKKCAFAKTDIKYLRESRMQNQGQAGLLQLSAVYNCTIDMIGNTLFLPGMEVWVDPYGFGGPKFGMPNEPPLRSMSSASEVDHFNELVQSAMDQGEEARDTIDNSDVHNKPAMGINSYANVMGIGGYQLITKVTCKIAPGEYSTTIEGRHVYTGYPKAYNVQALYESLRDQDINSPKAQQVGPKTFCTKMATKLESTDQTLTVDDVNNTPMED